MRAWELHLMGFLVIPSWPGLGQTDLGDEGVTLTG